MKISLSSSIKYAFLLALGVFLLVLAFNGQDFSALKTQLRRANYWWVLASALICLVAHVLRAMRWRMVVEPLGEHTPSRKNMFYAVMIGYLANLAFPRMGEISRCAVIHKTNQIPLNQLIGTVITERLIDLLSLGMVTALGICLQYELITTFLYQNLLPRLSVNISNTVLLLVGFGLFTASGVMLYIMFKKRHWVLVQKIISLWNGFSHGVRSVRRIQNKWLFGVLSILIWGGYFCSIYFCMLAFDSLSYLGPVVALSVLVLGSFGMIAPVQGGIGAFHWIVAEGLMLYAITRSDGLAFATMLHSSQAIVVLITGVASLVMVAISSSKTISAADQRDVEKVVRKQMEDL